MTKKEKALRHNINYADIKIADWRTALANRLEKTGVLDLNALDMIEMYAEWKGAWKEELLKN